MAKIKSGNGLFWGCFTVLVASAFGFVFRSFLMAQWGLEFGLSKTQQGEIFGVSFWPFGISIVLFSLIIDRIGYRESMIFAFICHILSVIITFFAEGYTMLYIGTLLFAVGNGTAEAVINPVVATMYAGDKTKGLNKLHAGWPAGMVLAGLLGIAFLHFGVHWKIMIGFIMLPTIAYGWMIFRHHIPANERVQAGVSYLEMLKEVGVGGMLIIIALCTFQLGDLIGWSITASVVIIVLLTALVWYFVRSFGRPLLLLILLLMILLATTELGTDSWITDLMTPQMAALGLQGGWVLIYTSVIMAVLRLYAGVFAHRFSPLSLLALSAAIAFAGLQMLSFSAGVTILVAATIYALGKTFLWGTMLGLVSEQFPKGGALALNFTSAVGQVGVGVIGAVVLGFAQDKQLDTNLAKMDQTQQTTYHSTYVTEEKKSLFGEYRAIDEQKLSQADPATVAVIREAQATAKQDALWYVSWLPAVLLIVYLSILLYFKARGGYRPVVILKNGD